MPARSTRAQRAPTDAAGDRPRRGVARCRARRRRCRRRDRRRARRRTDSSRPQRSCCCCRRCAPPHPNGTRSVRSTQTPYGTTCSAWHPGFGITPQARRRPTGTKGHSGRCPARRRSSNGGAAARVSGADPGAGVLAHETGWDWGLTFAAGFLPRPFMQMPIFPPCEPLTTPTPANSHPCGSLAANLSQATTPAKRAPEAACSLSFKQVGWVSGALVALDRPLAGLIGAKPALLHRCSRWFMAPC
jgi:hypothetical protein